MSTRVDTLSLTATALAVTAVSSLVAYTVYQKSVAGTASADSSKNNDANSTNLSDPTVILAKLAQVMELVQKQFPRSEQIPAHVVQVTFAALMRAIDEAEAADPEFRDNIYRKDGEEVSLAEAKEHQLYLNLAEAAYSEGENATKELIKILAEDGYELIRHHNFPEPGRVGHYIAVNSETKTIVLSIKGTSNLSDVLTDVLAKGTEYTLPSPVILGDDSPGTSSDGENVKICVHEGMGAASLALVEEVQFLFEKYFLPLGYKVVICGHSLGAGTACLVGILLQHRIPFLRENFNKADPCLVVKAFATPPCLDLKTALATQPYITSVIDNDDIITRASLANLRFYIMVVERLVAIFREQNLSPDSFEGAQNLLKAFLYGSSSKSEFPLKKEDLLKFVELSNTEYMNMDIVQSQDALMVPGRVVHYWNTNRVKLSSAACLQARSDSQRNTVNARALNATMVACRVLEFSDAMISDHSTASYRDVLERFVKEKEGA